jgi:hypothetical protein
VNRTIDGNGSQSRASPNSRSASCQSSMVRRIGRAMTLASCIRSLGERSAAMGASLLKVTGRPQFKTPSRAADLKAGKQVFEDHRAGATAPTAWAYCIGRPHWWLRLSAALGAYRFNDCASMHRVLTAACFVKARMPLGRADLTDHEAFDIAAFHQPATAAIWRISRLPGPIRQAGRFRLRTICRRFSNRAARVRSIRADRGVL